MWETISAIVSLLVSVAALFMPFLSNWIQDKQRERKEAQARREQIERDETQRREMQREVRSYYRELNDRLNRADLKISAEIQKMREGK